MSGIMLRRLAWSSVPSPSFSVARLNEIISPARRNNERNHISGMLLFTGANFLEILEGGELDLRDLWLRLERDRRHCDLLRIGDDLCGERWFPEWRMGYIVDTKVDAQIESLRSLKARTDLDSPGADTQVGTFRPLPSPSKPKWAEFIHPLMLSADSM